MGMTLQQAIDTAEMVLNDTSNVTYTAGELLEYGNGAIRTLVSLVPQYFYERGEVQCVAGETAQAVTFGDAHALVSVDRIKGGDIVAPADKAALDRFSPSWQTAAAGAAENWMPHADSAVRFYVYPKAPVGQVLEVTYVAIPATYAAADDTGLPVTLAPAVADYIVGMAMSKDDEHINAGRAQAFLGSFAARIKGA